MSSNLLPLPLRICDPLALEDALAAALARDFHQPLLTLADLARVQSLHSALVAGSKVPQVDREAYLRTLAEGFYVTQDLGAKFPAVATFEWYDTLQPRQPVLQARSWRQHAHLIVFQAGVLYSQRAHAEDLSDADGLRRAVADLQASAGCFQYLLDHRQDNQNTAEHDGLESDAVGLGAATLACLRAAVLGEAQELVWQKAARNTTTKDTLVARLSSAVSDLYEEATEHARASGTIQDSWTNHWRVKHLHFRAAAQYRMAQHLLHTFEYGQQVAYLRAATGLCGEALRHSRHVAAEVLADLGGLQGTVSSSLGAAERDNSLVYSKLVPHSLPIIASISMVEPKTPPFLTERDPDFALVFEKLVPFTVVQIGQAFRERQDQYIASAFREPLRTLTTSLLRFLAERQLPAALDSLQVPESVPDSIVHHAQDIMARGGTRSVLTTMGEIGVAAANARALVEECAERLRLERHEDDLMREREGPDRWTRVPSSTTSAKHLLTVEKMRNYLSQGQQSDAVLGECFAAVKESLDVYCGGLDVLRRHIPTHGHVHMSAVCERVAHELRRLLREVADLETKRERFTGSIDYKLRNHNVEDVVTSAYRRNPGSFHAHGSVDRAAFEYIYDNHIAFFSTDLTYVERLEQAQRELEANIDTALDKFTRARTASLDAAQERRLMVLQKLEADYVKYLELVQNLDLASRFYATFLERGSGVLKELDGYLLSRREDARELALHIRDQRNFEGIEQSMARNLGNLAAPRLHRAGSSSGINFS